MAWTLEQRQRHSERMKLVAGRKAKDRRSGTSGTGHIRYVGATKDTYRRQRLHGSRSNNKGNSPRNRWIRDILDRGQKPTFALVEETVDLNAGEQHWIAKLRGDGIDLLNQNAGGRDQSHLNKAPRSHVQRGERSELHKLMAEIALDLRAARRNWP